MSHNLIFDNGIGSIVILRGNDNTTTTGKPGGEYRQAVGIVTERDVVSDLGSDKAISLRTQLSEIMSTPLITISPANSLKDAIETM